MHGLSEKQCNDCCNVLKKQLKDHLWDDTTWRDRWRIRFVMWSPTLCTVLAERLITESKAQLDIDIDPDKFIEFWTRVLTELWPLVKQIIEEIMDMINS